MRDHKKLRAFDVADQLAMLTYRQTTSFPRDELFGLVSQMRRAAVSVASNIVLRFTSSDKAPKMLKFTANAKSGL